MLHGFVERAGLGRARARDQDASRLCGLVEELRVRAADLLEIRSVKLSAEQSDERAPQPFRLVAQEERRDIDVERRREGDGNGGGRRHHEAMDPFEGLLHDGWLTGDPSWASHGGVRLQGQLIAEVHEASLRCLPRGNLEGGFLVDPLEERGHLDEGSVHGVEVEPKEHLLPAPIDAQEGLAVPHQVGDSSRNEPLLLVVSEEAQVLAPHQDGEVDEVDPVRPREPVRLQCGSEPDAPDASAARRETRERPAKTVVLGQGIGVIVPALVPGLHLPEEVEQAGGQGSDHILNPSLFVHEGLLTLKGRARGF